jgi:hypothetical protein
MQPVRSLHSLILAFRDHYLDLLIFGREPKLTETSLEVGAVCDVPHTAVWLIDIAER